MILLPQAFRAVIIPLGSVLIALTKNTTIASAIGVAEAALLMKEMIENTAAVLTIGAIFAFGFVVLTLPLGLLFGWLGKRMAVAQVTGSSVLFDAPGPRARLRNRVFNAVTVAITLLVAWVVYIEARRKGPTRRGEVEAVPDRQPVEDIHPGRHPGHTDRRRGVSIVLALALGFLLGVGRMSSNGLDPVAVRRIRRVLPRRAGAVMMLFAFGLFAAYDIFPGKQLALAGVIAGLTLYNGAVIAEIVRAGVKALPRGQSEAAYALGLTWGQTMRSIQLPQAITSMLPVLISQLVVVLKDTAIGYQITFLETVRQGTNVGSAYGNSSQL